MAYLIKIVCAYLGFILFGSIAAGIAGNPFAPVILIAGIVGAGVGWVKAPTPAALMAWLRRLIGRDTPPAAAASDAPPAP